MSAKNGNGVNLQLLGKVKANRKQEAPSVLRMAYIVPSNRWCLVDASQPIIELFVSPPGSLVLLPGDESRPVPGMMNLAILTATLQADGPSYRREAATGFAVPVESVADWNKNGPPTPVRDALMAFVTGDGWPTVDNPLVYSLGILMPPSFVIAGGGYGGECAFPEDVV